MKQKLLTTIMLALMLVFFGKGVWGQTTINFDTPANWIQDGAIALTSYGNHGYEEGVVSFTSVNTLRNTTSAQDGFPGALGTYSWRIRNVLGAKITADITSGGVSTFSIAVRRWDGSPIPNYTVKYSLNSGTDWTSLANIDGSLLTTSDWFTYNGTINSDVSNILLEIANTGTTERIMIDDFTWTGYSAGGNIPPSITNIIETPNSEITSSTTVSVSADITDSDGTISLSQLKWGTTTGVYPNTINMTLSSGSTYTTDIDIPAQANGTTVYYVVYAEDNEAAATTSLQQNYSVIDPAFTTLPYSEIFEFNLGVCYPYTVAGTNPWGWDGASQTALANGYLSALEEQWLVIPGINLNLTTNEIMTFTNYAKYGTIDANNYLKLFYSTDYPGIGDPTTSTWTELSFDQPAAGAVGITEIMTPSGNIDLSGISGASVYLAFKYYSTDSPTSWKVDDILIQSVTVAVPQAFAAASAGTNQIDLTFTTNLNADDVVIVYNGDGTFTDPSGAPPVAGQPFAGGTLLYSGTVSPQSHTGLTPEQTVYYKAFSYDGINYSPGLTDNATTDATEPTNHATSFSATTNSSSAITVAWTDAVPASAGYLIKGSDVSYVDIAAPVDGVAEVDALLVKNVAGGVETKQFTGLTALTPYYFKIFPYNGTGGAINYKTDGSVPEATATTTEAPAIPDVVINEVDSDTPGTDVAEFIELYDGGIGNSDLSGFIVVLFNGNTDLSYLTIDLNGYSTDAQGYFMIGSTGMGTPIEIPPGSSGWLQNGQDAVAIYYDAAVNFPNGTAVTITNLVDALVYDTSDADDPGLLVLLNPGELQINESENGASDVQSMQRLPNGTGGKRNTSTYGVTTPTPGAINEYIITDFPYAQSFDGERFAPVGWTNVKTAGPEDPFHDGTWDRQTVGDHPTCAPQSGVGMARYNSYNLETGTKGELATPSITFPNDEYLVSFWMYRNETGYGDMEEGVNVYFNTSNSSTGGTLLGTIYRELNQPPVVVTEGWYQYTFSMPSGAAGSGKYIIFEGFSAWAFNLFIDEVSIEGFPTTNWSGTTDNDWNTAGNWSNGIPGSTSNVTIPAGLTNYPTLPSSGECNNLTIESSALGDGSLMGQGFLTVNGTTTIQRYTTQAVWHGISGPLDNDDFNSLYLGGTPEVWGLNYIEATNLYDYETDLATDLGDAKGWMVWVGGDTPQTFNFTGDLRGGPVGPVALTNTGPDALHGYNFVGNPYSSAIDWNAASGWTKTNVDAGIWIWNGTNWSTYVTGIGGTNGGSQYVSLAQGFFVQVNAAQGSGTLGMTTDVQVHNGAAFMKSAKSTPSDFIKLKLIDGEKSDESIIHLNPEATEGYDGQFDMHKMFSWNEDYPQLYSTANNFMAINSLPKETVMVPMDVRGLDGNEMTIALEEVTDFAQVYLSDEYTGIQTNLMEMPYTFTYDAGQTDRFTIYFTVVGTTENQLENIRVYSFDQKIRVIIPMELNAQVEVVNMLGQTVRETDAHLGTRDINMDHGGYYLVNITGDNQRVTRKVFIK